jgi:hypothetical protein
MEPNRSEPFEVVMLKLGVSEVAAKPEDFRRVPIEATDPLQAMQSDAVAKTEGYRPLFAARPGVLTDPEVHARRRAFEAGGNGEQTKNW